MSQGRTGNRPALPFFGESKARSASVTASGCSVIIIWPAVGSVTTRAPAMASISGFAFAGGVMRSAAPRRKSVGQRTVAARSRARS